jgi:hypothetical protein
MVARILKKSAFLAKRYLHVITYWYMSAFRSDRQIVFRTRRSRQRKILPEPFVATELELDKQSQLWATRCGLVRSGSGQFFATEAAGEKFDAYADLCRFTQSHGIDSGDIRLLFIAREHSDETPIP